MRGGGGGGGGIGGGRGGGKREKEKKRIQKKQSVPKPGNPEKKMEYTSRVIQLRGSRPQGQLVCNPWASYRLHSK